MSWGLYHVARQMRAADDPTRRRQAAIICYTAVVPLVLSTTTDVVLPSLGIHAVPNMAPDFTIIWAVGLVLAIAKYGLLEMTPSVAADKIISTMSDSLLLLDEEGKIILANRAARDLLAYGENELKGKGIGLLFPSDLSETQMVPLGAAEDIVGCDYVLRTKKDDEIPVIFSSSVMRGTAGEAIGTVCVARDITERKRAEEEVKSYSVQLEAANKELESFSYSVSHDLRAPLRGIDGFSQALLEDYSDRLDNVGQDYLKRVRSGAQRMGQLIDDLLELSRLTRSEMRDDEVDLSAIAGDITGGLREGEPHRQVDLSISPDLVVRGDPALLRAVLSNLLGNAWKFTAGKEHARIELGMEESEEGKAYFVRDNGAGFDMAYADKLFGVFQRLHNTTEFPGTGIGLATVQRIVHRHGGRVWAEGEVGKGATFYFTLSA